MRVYIPATVAMLRTLLDEGRLSAAGDTAFALTPALREHYTSDDVEELEYAAQREASLAALRLIAAELDKDPEARPRRVVLSADVEGAVARPDLDTAVVRLAGPVPMKRIAAVHVDTADAEEAVRAAARVVDAADLGDPEAEFVVGDAEDHELAWYAPQELPFLLELMPDPPTDGG